MKKTVLFIYLILPVSCSFSFTVFKLFSSGFKIFRASFVRILDFFSHSYSFQRRKENTLPIYYLYFSTRRFLIAPNSRNRLLRPFPTLFHGTNVGLRFPAIVTLEYSIDLMTRLSIVVINSKFHTVIHIG